MAGNRFQLPVAAVYDENGAPLAGAKLYFYENESTTPKNTYSNIHLTTPNPWPVEADSSGRFTDDIFMETDPYRIKFTDSSDVQIWLKDNCNTFNGSATGNSFPFPGAVIEFYGNQNQLNVALSSFWYLMDGNNGLPNLDDTYIKCCIDVASIGTSGGSNVPTGTISDTVLTEAQIPSHYHFLSNNQSGTSSITSSNFLNEQASFGDNRTYLLGGSSTSPTLARSSLTGNGDGHSHALTMNDYDPPFYQLIKLVYLGF